MVVSLDLEGEVEFVVERDDPGIVHECGPKPPGVEFFGDLSQRGQQPVVLGDRSRAVGCRVRQLDSSPERLVDAVLGPRLGERLQFSVAWTSPLCREV